MTAGFPSNWMEMLDDSKSTGSPPWPSIFSFKRGLDPPFPMIRSILSPMTERSSGWTKSNFGRPTSSSAVERPSRPARVWLVNKTPARSTIKTPSGICWMIDLKFFFDFRRTSSAFFRGAVSRRTAMTAGCPS